MPLSTDTPTTPGSGKAWFILRFESYLLGLNDILCLSDPAELIQTEASALETTLLERFGRRGSYITNLCITLPSNNSQRVQVTTRHIVTFLRDLPRGKSVIQPDLWGSGGNVLMVSFMDVDE